MEPQQDTQLNYEQLGEEAAKLDVGGIQQAANALTAQGVAISLPQVCDIYKKVRPVLVIITKIPLIPGTIKTAINAFISGMDLICP